MAIMNFPENPSVGDIYTFEGYRYRWSGVKWQSNWVRSDTSLDLFKNELASEGTETVIAGVKAKDLPEAVLTLKWHPLRSKIWTGFIPADGQLVSRTLYPDAWGEVLAGNVPICTEAEWLADPAKRACYTIGDGSTNFRVPDYNGRSAGSLGSVFLRGDGVNAGAGGSIQGSSNKAHTHTRGTMNITGSFNTASGADGYGIATRELIGAFKAGGGNGSYLSRTQSGVQGMNESVAFDASRSWTGETSSEGSTEARPLNAAGCWVIKMFGAVKNAGSVDAASLATQVSLLDTKVNYVQSLIPGRNLLINGAFNIWQRGIATGIADGNFVYGLDRWYVGNTMGGAGHYHYDQQIDGLFVCARVLNNGVQQTSPTGAGYLEQPIEGVNMLGWYETPLVVSFWVKSTIAGQYSVGLAAGGEYGGDYTQTHAYTIEKANTWEKKTVRFKAIPASYFTDYGNKCKARLRFCFDGANNTTSAGEWVAGQYMSVAGQTKLSSVNQSEIRFAQVQLEKGEVATPFEHRPFGYELSLCRRYYRTDPDFRMSGSAVANGYFGSIVHFDTPMRAAPNVTWKQGYIALPGLTNVPAPTTSATAYNVRILYQCLAGSGGYDISGVLDLDAEI